MIERRDKVNQLLADAGFSIGERECIVEYLAGLGYFEAPASSHFHLSYPGGLADHSINVCEELVRLTKANEIRWEHVRSPYVVGLFHDICKSDTYIGHCGCYEYNDECLLNGHGEKSAMLTQLLIQLTEEEMLCIRYHMGAYYKEDWSGFDAAIKRYPSVLWTHMADMIASKLIEK